MATRKRTKSVRRPFPVHWKAPEWEAIDQTLKRLQAEHPGVRFTHTDVIRMGTTEFCERKLAGAA